MASILEYASEAVAGIPDGATVMIGGFGTAGQPVELIDALLASGSTTSPWLTTTPATATWASRR